MEFNYPFIKFQDQIVIYAGKDLNNTVTSSISCSTKIK